MQSTLYNATMTGDLTMAPRYAVNTQQLTVDTTKVNFFLECSNCASISSWQPAASPMVEMSVYQNGILRFNIDAGQSEPFTRFKISDTGLPVDDQHLIPATFGPYGDYQYTTSTEGVTFTQKGDAVAGKDDFEIILQYNPFRIQLSSNG